MTTTRLRAWLGTALLLLAALAGCGGTTDSTESQIRLLNASPDLSTASLYTDDDAQAQGVAPDTVSGYAEVDPGTYTVKLTNGIGSALASLSQELSKETRYTAVAWGRGSAASMALLTEADSDTDNITSGWGRMRVFNAAANDAGTLDIYLVPTTATAQDLDSYTPVVSTAGSTVTGYTDLIAGTYRLLVTASGDTTDVRLDLPSFSLGDQQVLSLILEPSSGGVLVHALVLQHQAGLSVDKNPSARVRLIASVASAGAVQAQVNGSAVAAPLTSPQIGAYALVPAGADTVAITVNGQAVTPDVTTFAAGADYTLLVAGTASAAQVKTITDDNRLPAPTSSSSSTTTTSTKLKIRLLNGVLTTNGAITTTPLSLAVNSVSVATVTPPDASAYSQVASSSAASVIVSSPSNPSVFATNNNTTTTLLANGVYTVFVLDGASAPQGQLLSER